MRKLLAVLFGLMMVLGTLVMTTTPATAQDDDCKTVAATITARLDSGQAGNNWARDTFTRTVEVCQVSPGHYEVDGSDDGTFVVIEGETPPGGTGSPLPADVEGTIVGSWTASLTAAEDWGTFVTEGLNVNDRSTSQWVLLLFTDAQGSLNDDWEWTYTTCSEKWVNAAAGNSGNITGAACPAPSPSESPNPTPSATPSTPVATVSPTATQPPVAAGLPVTGSSLPWFLGGGAALLGLGGGLMFLGRRRRVQVD